MTIANDGPRVFISAAEQSADEHAANFIDAARERLPGASFVGLAGPAMRAAGCETIADMTARSAMAGAAFKRVPEALRVLRRIKQCLDQGRFDAAVVVDSPTLNLPIAKICRRRGVPVLYYIAPQTWAWAPWRNRRIRKRVSRMACIWPFEEAYFRGYGIPATYVGHPTIDRLLDLRLDEDKAPEQRGQRPPVVAILPGSRRHVVDEVFPGQLAVAAAVAAQFQGARFPIVAANQERLSAPPGEAGHRR